MKSFLYHFQINVSDVIVSNPFYKDLLGYLGYEITEEGDWGLMSTNINDKNHGDVLIIKTDAKYLPNKYHRKNIGLNHVCFGVSSKSDVDKFAEEFLKPRNIPTLYNTPKEYPEYTPGYYAVFFEDPDRVKLEVVYIPEFSK